MYGKGSYCAQERAGDLVALKRALEGEDEDLPSLKRERREDKIEGNQKVKLAGAIPRSLRRRTRSHARRVMPVKLRMKPLPPGRKGKECREDRRKKSRLRREWAEKLYRGGAGPHHLPSHFWAVKRMRMRVLWDHIIGYSLNDKSYSAVARVRPLCVSTSSDPTRLIGALCTQALRSRCVLQDLSYMTPIILQGSRDHICAVLALLEVCC